MTSPLSAKCAVFVAAVMLLSSLLVAQPPRDGDDDLIADPVPTRDGGIPREQLLQEDGGDQEGTEEGVPRFRRDVDDTRIRPYLLPPDRSQWKLGVYAYNTDTGVVVTQVVPGSAAAREGLEQGDRIVNVGGYQVGYVQDRLYPLGAELQRHAGRRGTVTLLIQNVRTDGLVNRDVPLDRGRYSPASTRERGRP